MTTLPIVQLDYDEDAVVAMLHVLRSLPKAKQTDTLVVVMKVFIFAEDGTP